METETSQCSSSLPPENPVESYIGTFVTLISNYDLRYEGVLYYLNLQDWTLGLQNVICYGTEGRGKNGFQIRPSNQVYHYIVFNGTEIKDILVKPPFTRCGYGCSPKGAKIRQKVPLISNENLENSEKPQATTDSEASLVNGSVNDRLHIASDPFTQPQFPGSNYYDPRSNHVYESMPYGLLNQAPIYNASKLMFTPTNPSPSFFTTFPPVPISLPPIYGGFNFETVNKNFKKYEMWGPSGNNNQRDETASNPFDRIERPYNPFGSIERPLDYSEEISNYIQRRPLLQQPPFNFNL